MQPIIIFDIETDGLLEEVTKIHCISYIKLLDNNVIDKKTLTKKEEYEILFKEEAVFVGHNIVRYDIPVINKILGLKIDKNIIDTLGLSWYLFPDKKTHGLEYWGNFFQNKKKEVLDWKEDSLEIYTERCERDVEINYDLFVLFKEYLTNLYGKFQNTKNIIEYLNFKLGCLQDQEISGITLDIKSCEESLNFLQDIFEKKTNLLSEIMPPDIGNILLKKPKKLFDKFENLTKQGIIWIKELSERNLLEDVEIIKEKPNPGSNKQLKDWLYRLGWVPKTFKISKQTGKKIEQISLPFGAGICNSVKELYNIEPNLKELENYYVIKHRIGLLKSFQKNLKGSKVYSTAHGLTNTLRLTHSEPLANLPKPSVFFGEKIRSVLTIPNENYIMCGSDISGLEDNTKQHYIYFYDPQYVKEMRIPGFCPHLDIGMLANLITKEEANFYKYIENLSEDDRKKTSEEDVTKYKKIKNKRFTAKTTNFSATYGAGPAKIAETAKISVEEGKNLHKIYWDRNWAVRKVAKDTITKEVNFINSKENKTFFEEKEIKEITYFLDTQKWIYNPVSKFWVFLKSDKDKFSTLNQSTGVFVFDSWVHKIKQKIKDYDIKIVMQYHDEILIICHKALKNFVENVLKESMEEVNLLLKLNVEISISTAWGKNYAECH